MTLQLRLLGQVRMYSGDVAFVGRSTQKRRLGLLGLLSVAGGVPVSRDKLIAMLWPEMSAEQSRRLLSEAIYVIRKEIGTETILSVGDDVSLDASIIDSDVGCFQRAYSAGQLERAVDLYAGAFMDGWIPDDAGEFEQWISNERNRLAGICTKALEKLIAQAELRGDLATAIDFSDRLVALEPLSSSRAIKLATLLEQRGEIGEALNSLADHAHRLTEDLGAEPPAHVTECMARLRTRAGRRHAYRSDDESIPSIAIRPDAALHASSTLTNAQPRTHTDTPRSGKVALFAVALAVMAVLYSFLSPKAKTLDIPYQNRLAVLYMRDLSAEQDLGPIADGITEELIHALTGANAFEVVSSSGTKQYRSQSLGLDSIARALRVGSVIDGSIQRAGDRLAVTIRLSDGVSGTVLSSSSVERSMHDMFQLQRDVAQDAASAIRQRLGQVVRLRKNTTGSLNVRATQLVLRASRERDDAIQGITPTDTASINSAKLGLGRADSLFGEAALEDRKWIVPLLERGHTAVRLASLTQGPGRASILDRAARWADSAVAMNTSSASALELRGMIRWGAIHANAMDASHKPGIASAKQDLEKAVEIDSTRALAWATLTNLYWITGDPTRAYMAGQRAFAADAYLDGASKIILQIFFSAIERSALDDAQRWCDLGRRTFPNDFQFTLCALTMMKYDTSAKPDPKRAWELVARLDTLDPGATARRAGHAYTPVYRRLAAASVSARAGDIKLARSELERAKLAASGDSDMLLDIASDEVNLLMVFGEHAQATKVLATLIAARPLMEGLAARDPLLNQVKKLP